MTEPEKLTANLSVACTVDLVQYSADRRWAWEISFTVPGKEDAQPALNYHAFLGGRYSGPRFSTAEAALEDARAWLKKLGFVTQ